MGEATMNLDDAIDAYATARDLRASTLASYRLAVRGLSAWLNRPATAADLTAETLNRWLRFLRESDQLSPYSIATYRRSILVVYRWLARQKVVQRPDSLELVALRCPPTPRDVWTADEVRHLVASVDRVPDELVQRTGIRWRSWWRSLIMAGWDTAFRWSDLARLRRADIRSDGLLRIVQSKTGIEHVVRLRPETIAAIESAMSGRTERSPIWPVPYVTWRHRQFRRLLRVAELRGTLQKLRRSAITAAELDRAGSGHLLAGHTTPATTFRWYIPRLALVTNPPAPPALESTPMDRRPRPEHSATRRIVHAFRTPGETVELIGADGTVAELQLRQAANGRREIVIATDTARPLELKIRRG
jgi:site-specific recombinase XerD